MPMMLIMLISRATAIVRTIANVVVMIIALMMATSILAMLCITGILATVLVFGNYDGEYDCSLMTTLPIMMVNVRLLINNMMRNNLITEHKMPDSRLGHAKRQCRQRSRGPTPIRPPRAQGSPSRLSLRWRRARSWSLASGSWAERAFRRETGPSLARRTVGRGVPTAARAFVQDLRTPDSLRGLEISKARLLQPPPVWLAYRLAGDHAKGAAARQTLLQVLDNSLPGARVELFAGTKRICHEGASKLPISRVFARVCGHCVFGAAIPRHSRSTVVGS